MYKNVTPTSSKQKQGHGLDPNDHKEMRHFVKDGEFIIIRRKEFRTERDPRSNEDVEIIRVTAKESS